jgi:hypothetical protein
MVLYAFGVTVLTYIICGDYIALQVLLMSSAAISFDQRSLHLSRVRRDSLAKVTALVVSVESL